MDIIQVVENLSEEMYQRFKYAVETGKWPEGTKVDDEQRETAMKIVMAYQSRVLKPDEIFMVGDDGNIVDKSKSQLKSEFNRPTDNDIARFKDL